MSKNTVPKCKIWQKRFLMWRIVHSPLIGLGQVTHLSSGEDTLPALATRQSYCSISFRDII